MNHTGKPRFRCFSTHTESMQQIFKLRDTRNRLIRTINSKDDLIASLRKEVEALNQFLKHEQETRSNHRD